MRFDEVTATHFGPFRGETLQLAPGFTVVHGPNESGKSSWGAALFASLAGRRRARGRGSKDEAAFRARHKPWVGPRWQVSASITTDSGETLWVTQDLVGGTTRIVPEGADKPLSRVELEKRFGLSHSAWDDIDIGELFGLNRGTLRATSFVPQAEILRVLQDAGELQEFIQRAASTETLDTTAHQVLEGLRAQAAQRVGSLTMGQRPMRRVTAELAQAEGETYQLRATRDELRRTATQVRHLTGLENRARVELDHVHVLQRWVEADTLQQRVTKVREYDEQITRLASTPEPAAPELVDRVREARTGFLRRDALPSAPTGPSVDDLRRQLAELPEPPEGDTIPEPGIRRLWEDLNHATAALESRESMPKTANPVSAAEPGASSGELRAFAQRISAPRPVWDPAQDEAETRLRNQHDAALKEHGRATEEWHARAESYEAEHREYAAAKERYDADRTAYEQAFNAYRASQTGSGGSGRRSSQQYASRGFGLPQWLLVGGGILLALGLVALLLEPIIGGVAAVLGLLILFGGLALGGRPNRVADGASRSWGIPEPPAAPVPPNAPRSTHPGDKPREPVMSDRVADIVQRRETWQRAAYEFDHRRAALLNELSERGLPTGPADLEGLARRLDEEEGAKKLAETQRGELEELRVEVGDAAHRLVEALRARDADSVQNPRDAQAVDAAFRRYEQACVERAEVLEKANQREELTRTLQLRTEADSTHAAAIARDAARASALMGLAQELGLTCDDPQAAADSTGDWLKAQAEADEARRRRDKVQSLREQHLDGASLPELEEQLVSLTQDLGDRPENLPANVDELVLEARRAVEEAVTQRAGAEGELARLRRDERDLAGAIDEEGRLRRDKESLEELKAILDLATEHLEAAQREAHRSISPVLEGAIRHRLPLITAGRYQDARVDPKTLGVELQERSGAWRDASLLSQGTTEQTFLMLRLALVENLGTQETMPFILDDVTVQCDATRTVALLDLLRDVSRERQVILFSQESGVAEWAREHLSGETDNLLSLSTQG